MHSSFEPPAVRNARCWGRPELPAAWELRRTGFRPIMRVLIAEEELVEDDETISITVRSKKMARLEAVLLVAEGALSTRKLVQFATLADTAEANALIERLNTAYDAVNSAFRIERVATGYQLLTRPRLAFWLDKIHHRQAELKLSSPALETLTIVAYHAPITRADIEAIRGVQCSEMLKQLMERGLVRIAGEDDSLGRPYLYGTTRKFLELFGLRSLDDLPMAERLRRAKATKNESEVEEAEADAPEEAIEADVADDEDAAQAA